MRELKVIVGMDWLEQIKALIDCRKKGVRVLTLSGGELTILGKGSRSSSTFCFVARARRYSQHGCEWFLAYVIKTREEKKETILEVLIVYEFPDVFPEDLPGVPPRLSQVELTTYSTSSKELCGFLKLIYDQDITR